MFTSEIFDMYQQYVAYKRWHTETLEYFPSEIDGLRHASAALVVQKPTNIWNLKGECTVYREYQRQGSKAASN